MCVHMENPKEKVHFLDSEFYKVCTKHFFLICFVMILLDLIFVLLQFAFGLKGLLIACLIPCLNLFFFFVFKNELDAKQINKAFWIYAMFIYFLLAIIVNATFNEYIPIPVLNKILIAFFDGMGFIGWLILLTQEEFRLSLSKPLAIDTVAKMREDKNKIEIDEEDAIIGHKIDVETGDVTDEPVILPAKDRFLHMLILGPTGCGKTSQTIIPMIWRDMQIKNKTVGITVLEPKGDLAEKVYAMARYHNEELAKAKANGSYSKEKHGEHKVVLYFNPILDGCPYFNPLEGDEDDVIENMATTFNMLNADSPQYFKDMTDGLVRKAVKLVKRLHGDNATLLDLNTIVWNVGDAGRKNYVMQLKRKSTMPDGSPIPPDIQKENDELIDWFLNDYYAGIGGAKGAPKTYENTSGVRTQITKLVSNKYLKRALNPPREGDAGYNDYLLFQQKCAAEGIPHKINFDDAFEKGYIITMSTAQGTLRDLGRFLGYFIILQLQASVFRRPGNENTRIHNMLYIDEFQVYSNSGFADMLTMGRSYRVASHLATQARAQIGMGQGRAGQDFVALVSTNARNKIIYPGVSFDDARYYSDEFGADMVVKKQKSMRQKAFFSLMNDKQVTYQDKEEEEVRFTPTDIIDRPFGQITYRLVQKNSVSAPGVSKIEYIPKEINDLLDIMIEEDNAKRLRIGSARQDYEAAKNADANQFTSTQNDTMKVDMYKQTDLSTSPPASAPIITPPIVENVRDPFADLPDQEFSLFEGDIPKNTEGLDVFNGGNLELKNELDKLKIAVPHPVIDDSLDFLDDDNDDTFRTDNRPINPMLDKEENVTFYNNGARIPDKPQPEAPVSPIRRKSVENVENKRAVREMKPQIDTSLPFDDDM